MKRNCFAALAIILLTCSTVQAEEPFVEESAWVMEAANTYGEAWASGEVDRIIDLHAEGSEFVSYVNGPQRAVGKPALREAFGKILADFPNYASAPRSLRVGPDFVVLEYDILSGPSGEFVLGGRRYRAKCSDYRVSAIDVIAFDEQGKVTSKHSYIDTVTILQHADVIGDR